MRYYTWKLSQLKAKRQSTLTLLPGFVSISLCHCLLSLWSQDIQTELTDQKGDFSMFIKNEKEMVVYVSILFS